MDTRYSCNYSGICEEDSHGAFATLEECRTGCESQPNKEIQYIIDQYDLDSALSTSPSDQVAILRRLTGVTVPLIEAREILIAIRDKDYESLVLIEELLPWIREHHHYSLLFRLPQGTLSAAEIQTISLPEVTPEQITQIVEEHGFKTSKMKYADILLLEDVPANFGQLMGMEGKVLSKVPYPGFTGRSPFGINRRPSVDYFRYSIPGNKVAFIRTGQLTDPEKT